MDDSSVAGEHRRPLPYSEIAERGLLGCILVDPDEVLDLCLQADLSPQAFFFKHHRDLFRLLLDMSKKGEGIDLITVRNRAKETGLISDHDEHDELERLVDTAQSAIYTADYITIVRNKALLRNLIDTSRQIVEECHSDEAVAETILNEAGTKIFELAEGKDTELRLWKDLVDLSMKEVQAIMSGEGAPPGLKTGFKYMDDMMNGLQPKDMIVLAARPSMGKTAFALNIVENIASGRADPKNGPRPVGVFSLEMPAEQLLRRVLCSNAQVSYHDISKRLVSQNKFKEILAHADSIAGYPIVIDDTAGLDVMNLRARARRMKNKYGIELLVIDYLQLMHYGSESSDGRQHEVAKISNMVKAMAKELDLPVIVLSQLSRAPETRDKKAIPRLSDLRDSGAIEQDADAVWLLRRPVKYLTEEERNDPKYKDELNLAIVDVAKHRNGGTGEIRLNFIEKFTLFQDREERFQDDM